MIAVECHRNVLTAGYNTGSGGEWRWDMGLRGDATIGYKNWWDTQQYDFDREQALLTVFLPDYVWFSFSIEGVMSRRFCYMCEIH